MTEEPTRYGPAERFDRWIERHITPVLAVSVVVAIILIVANNLD